MNNMFRNFAVENQTTSTMTKKTYKTPPIAWLKVTDYMHGWLQHELGSGAMIRDQRVVCLQHLPGIKEVMRMESAEDSAENKLVCNSMSAIRKNCVFAGVGLDSKMIEREYGLNEKMLELFVPIECSKNCMTKEGVLRPWNLNVAFGKEQATALQRLIRQAFWDAVEEYNVEYASKQDGKYPAVEMIESFCIETHTPDIYAEVIRREWQRRVQRGEHQMPERKELKAISLEDF